MAGLDYLRAIRDGALPPAPISGATALSGAAGTDSLSTSFAAGDTITVNGTPITFVASGATISQAGPGGALLACLGFFVIAALAYRKVTGAVMIRFL